GEVEVGAAARGVRPRGGLRVCRGDRIGRRRPARPLRNREDAPVERRSQGSPDEAGDRECAGGVLVHLRSRRSARAGPRLAAPTITNELNASQKKIAITTPKPP